MPAIRVDCQPPQPVASGTYSMTSSARASSVGGIVILERLGGLDVDHQLEFGGLLDRKVGRASHP